MRRTFGFLIMSVCRVQRWKLWFKFRDKARLGSLHSEFICKQEQTSVRRRHTRSSHSSALTSPFKSSFYILSVFSDAASSHTDIKYTICTICKNMYFISFSIHIWSPFLYIHKSTFLSPSQFLLLFTKSSLGSQFPIFNWTFPGKYVNYFKALFYLWLLLCSAVGITTVQNLGNNVWKIDFY